MSKKRGNDAALEDAMAEALNAVEKREQSRKSAEQESGAQASEIPVSVESDTQVDYRVTPRADEDQGEGEAAAQDGGEDGGGEPWRAELEAKDAALATMKDQLLRLAADFDNFRKRAARDGEEARKFGIERVARELLNVLDNLDRALEHATKSDPVVDGVKMVAKQFLDVLSQFGIKPFSAKDQAFDPERHEAISQQVIEGKSPGTVIAELQRGYMLHDRLLRPARVVIAAAPAPREEAAGAEAS